MKYVAYVPDKQGSFRCYLSDNGRETRFLGCRHDKPRQAAAHTSPVYVPASRSVLDGPSDSRSAGQHRGLSEASGRTSLAGASSPAVTPRAAGDHSLGL